MQATYLKSFGLLEPAFRLAPDLRFFYANRPYQEAFLALRYAIKLRSGLIVLTGESGGGKTTLIKMVKERCESNIHIGEISSFTQPSSALLPCVMQAIGILTSAPDRPEMLRELRRYLVQQLIQDRTVVVVLEDAHELDLESFMQLQLVSRLRWDQKNLLQIVLTGTPALETKLQDSALESFRKRVALWYRVEPLRAEEVGRYIKHRLSCAGYAGEALFAAGAVERIATYSRGIPGLVNALCKKALYSAHTASRDRVSAEIVEQAWQALQRTGESEFEVAALLSDIRFYSQPTEEPIANGPKHGRALRQMEQFGIEERMRGMGDQRARRLGEKFPWLRTFQEAVRRNAVHSFGKLRVFAESERKSISAARALLTSLERGRSSSRWFSRSALIAMVSLAGSAAVLLRWPETGPGSYARITTETRAETEKALAPPQPSAEVPADVQLSTDVLQTRQGPAQATKPQGATRQQTAENTVNAENSSIRIASSQDKGITAKNDSSGRIVYVHTSEKRDLPVIEEIQHVLRIDGYSVRDTRFSRNATQGDVRFFFPRDRRNAERVKSLLQSELEGHGYSVTLQLLERDGKKFEHARPGKIEVWLPPLTAAERTG